MYLGTCDFQSAFTDTAGCEVDRVGGRPVWLTRQLPVRCSQCGEETLFVMQLSCPLDELHHRVLYVFMCPLPPCVRACNNWLVIRCQKAVEKTEAKVEVKSVFDEVSFDDCDWQTEEADKVDMDCDQVSSKGATKNEEVSDRMEELSISAVQTKDDDVTRTQGGCARASFKPFYINVSTEEETPEDLTHEFDILQQYLKDENISLSDLEGKTSDRGSGEASTETYEKRSASYVSQWQKKFFKRVKMCPQQVLRYSYKDQPLLYNGAIPATDIKACECGAPRVFELQLMPSLWDVLVPVQEGVSLDSECSCVFVFTCSNNCHADARTELAIVQRDVETKE